MLLPISILGKIIHKEGVFMLAVFLLGLFRVNSISCRKSLHILIRFKREEFVFFAEKTSKKLTKKNI